MMAEPDTATVAALRQRWQQLLADEDLTDAGEHVFDTLIAAYSEPHRHYHTVEHLLAILVELDRLEGAAMEVAYIHELDLDPGAVRLAAWLHDAVYDPQGHDNETASARLAGQVLPGLGLAYDRVVEVQRLVLQTEKHAPAVSDPAGCWLCDADLAILHADPDDYATYTLQVRREYGHVTDSEWRAGRSAVLRDLLAHPLLRLPRQSHRERRARANLSAELRALGSAEHDVA